MDELAADSAEMQQLLRQVQAGDRRAFDQLFTRHLPYLRRLMELWLEPKLRRRVDPSDIVQDAHLEAVRRLATYLAEPPMPFRLWLRQIAHDQLLKVRRRHLGASRRAMDREVPLPEQSSFLLAQQLLADQSSPSQHLDRRDLARRLRQAMAELPEADREILMLRNFEGMSYQEAAYVLEVEPAAARKRHGRALVRLHQILFDAGLRESQI